MVWQEMLVGGSAFGTVAPPTQTLCRPRVGCTGKQSKGRASGESGVAARRSFRPRSEFSVQLVQVIRLSTIQLKK